MVRTKQIQRLLPWETMVAFVLALAVAGCGRNEGRIAPATGSSGSEEKVLNIYNWENYIDSSVIPEFEKEYRVKVNYDVFDSSDVLETKLLTGRTNYDVVVPSAAYMQRQIQAGTYQKLNKELLPNLKNLDGSLIHSVEVNDPGNQYGVIYFWGVVGIGYNEEKIAAAMPNAPVDSLAMIFDPAVLKHFKDCGVLLIDVPDQVVETVLLYLGRDPNSESIEDLHAAEKVLLSIRPYVRYIDTSREIEALANGETCLDLTWTGDIGMSQARAKDAGRNIKINSVLPKEGSMMYFDMMAIPADAPHPETAHQFINFVLRPDVAARNSNAVHYATANATAYQLVDPAVYNEKTIYVDTDKRTRLHPITSHSQSFMRELNRVWTRFKAGQ